MRPNRRKFGIGTIIWTLTVLCPVIIFLIDGNIFSAIASTTLWVIGQAVLYKRYYVGVKPKYPLGVGNQDDIYFPRSNIPRPVYLDERERKKKKIAQQENSELDH